MAGLTTKTLKDGAGGTFAGYFYDDGVGLAPAPACPALAATTVPKSLLRARTGAGRCVQVQASNVSTAVEAYVVAIDVATDPAIGDAIAPRKFERLPTNDGSIDGKAEINTAFPVANGLVVVLTTSLTTYAPTNAQGTVTGQINISYL